MRVGRILVAGLTVVSLAGCGAMRENRSTCQAVSIGTGAVLGATLGALLVSEVANHGDSDGGKSWEIFGGGAGGAAGGSLIGWGISELVCEEPAPPPPPPPAPVVRTPPPPPVTERRGG